MKRAALLCALLISGAQGVSEEQRFLEGTGLKEGTFYQLRDDTQVATLLRSSAQVTLMTPRVDASLLEALLSRKSPKVTTVVLDESQANSETARKLRAAGGKVGFIRDLNAGLLLTETAFVEGGVLNGQPGKTQFTRERLIVELAGASFKQTLNYSFKGVSAVTWMR